MTKPDNNTDIFFWSIADSSVGDNLRDKVKAHYLTLAKSNDPANVINIRRFEKDLKTNLRIYGKVDTDKITIAQDKTNKYRLMQYGIFGKDGTKICSAPYNGISKLEVWEKLNIESRCLVYVNRYVDYDSRGFPHEFYVPKCERFVIPAIFQAGNGYFIKRFIILTHDSTDEIKHITNRMPYILPEEQANVWLKYGDKAFDHTIADVDYTLINTDKKK